MVESPKLHTNCCIVGGGPAGIMLGYLLARAGIDVIVLEKHKDFFRDFRGDTIHPSTLEIMYELGILDAFLKIQHQELKQLSLKIGDEIFTVADFSYLPTHCKFIAFMPQWDFLDFIAKQANQYKTFKLRMENEAVDLIKNNDRIIGVRAHCPEGSLEIYADLIIGADGRTSIIRKKSALEVIDYGVPIDVLWMRISRKEGDPSQSLGRVIQGKALVMIDRNTYYQCGLIVPKGSIEKIKAQGLDSFRNTIVELAPFLRDRIEELNSWDDIKLLSVQINRLKTWYRKGLLCIGDAAHAMSPAGGVGINLAIQDAVATANILSQSLLQKNLSTRILAKVQERRELPTTLIQNMQTYMHNLINQKVLGKPKTVAPWYIKLLLNRKIFSIIPAFIIGIGFRPEHIKLKYDSN